jgi:hypothetical protein
MSDNDDPAFEGLEDDEGRTQASKVLLLLLLFELPSRCCSPLQLVCTLSFLGSYGL